jgi:Spy/CpxP family protein refolding chaperone
MKRAMKWMAGAALSMALVAAQMPGRGNRPGGGAPPDPQQMVEMRINMLAKVLSLTDAQKAAATKIFADAMTANQALREKIAAAHEALAAAVKTNNTAAIEQAARDIGTYTGQIAATDGKAEAAFYLLLTPDQQKIFDAMPHHGPGGMGPGGMGMGMGAGPMGRGRWQNQD